MEEKIMGKHLKAILKEMCKRVKAPYTKMNFSKKNWFLTYSWTEEEENDFREWLIKYVKKDKYARMELAGRSHCDVNKLVNEFIFNYGWTTKK